MRIRPSTIIKTLFAIVILLAVSVYIFFNTRLFIQGPQIIIESPRNGFSSESGLIVVRGQVLNSSFISLNGRAVFVDENSNFTESVMLQPGYNIIVIEAKDKFDRQVNRRLELVYNVDEDEVFDYDINARGEIQTDGGIADEEKVESEDDDENDRSGENGANIGDVDDNQINNDGNGEIIENTI